MRDFLRKNISLIMTATLALGTIMVPSTSQAASNLKVTVSKKSIAVNTKTTIKTNVKATFKTSNKKVATVNSKGVVTGKKAGKAKITVTSKANSSQKKKITITVKDLVIKKPTGAKATLKPGKVTIVKANLDATFVSSNPNVATVDANGTVRAKSAGVAVITVTSKKFKKLVKTVTITVTEDIKVPTTEKVVTERPAVVTPVTEAPTSWQPITEEPKTEVTTNWQPITEEPKTEAPTSWQPITEEPKTEVTTKWQPITEEPKTEAPTSWQPITEEPKTEIPTTEQSIGKNKTAIGIKANYGTNKIPYVNENYSVFDERGIGITLLYDDGTEEKLPLKESSLADYYPEKVESDERGETVKCKVEYKGFTDEMDIEIIYTDSVYPMGIIPEPTDKLKTGDPNILSPDEYKVFLTYSDDTEVLIDNTKCTYSYIGESEKKHYEYLIAYETYFTDSAGNDLYVINTRYLYLPHE